MNPPEIWQEYDCPISGIDFDIHDADILTSGQQHYCCGCGAHHTAGVDIDVQTFILTQNGRLEFRALPKDSEEKSAWMLEAARADETR